jgi:hypothetical protein
MGDLLVVVKGMALAAVSVNVLAVAGFRGSRMTGYTGDRCMGRFSMFTGIQ